MGDETPQENDGEGGQAERYSSQVVLSVGFSTMLSVEMGGRTIGTIVWGRLLTTQDLTVQKNTANSKEIQVVPLTTEETRSRVYAVCHDHRSCAPGC